MTKPVRVGLKSCYVPEEACYILLVDGELVYHSFTEEGAIFHMKDLIENLDKKFRKQRPDCRTLIEEKNKFTTILQKVRDGMLLPGRPTQIHKIEIKRTTRILKFKPKQSERQ